MNLSHLQDIIAIANRSNVNIFCVVLKFCISIVYLVTST